MQNKKKRNNTQRDVSKQNTGGQDAGKKLRGTVFALEREGTRLWVMPGPKLSHVEVPDLQSALKQEIASGAREILFDLGATKILDSCGIGLLIAARNSLAAVQGGIRLVNANVHVYEQLQYLRLVDLLHVSTDEGEARHG